MRSVASLVRLALLGWGIAEAGLPHAVAEPAGPADAIVVRLVHPERQAAAILGLFDGARAPHPAAALSAWKRASKQPDRLGKPLEAVIAFFNPEMAVEWRVLHDAELCLSLDPAGGAARWYALVPRDDGTVAAAITAMRLTDGAEEPHVVDEGERLAVERLGRPGSALAAQVGGRLVLASDRDQLVHGLRRVPTSRRQADGAARAGLDPSIGIDSGVVFDLDPARLTVGQKAPLWFRRGVELIRGLGCRRLAGSLGVAGDHAGAEVTTTLEGGAPSAARVDRAWLEAMPSAGVMAVVSLAIEPDAAFWTSAFALADRVDRVDPARAGLAPLRTRVNLLAASAGVRPEADLWPHLRGITACLIGEPNRPGETTGGMAVLHTENESSARTLTNEFFPRLGALLTVGTREGVPVPDVPGQPRRLGKINGRDVAVWQLGRDVKIAWGDPGLIDSLKLERKPKQSVATLCGAAEPGGRGAPQRLGAFWPARCLPASFGLTADTPAFRVLADDPPVIWRGWSGPTRAHDSLEYSGLKQRIRQFLDLIPQSPPRIP